MPNISVQLRRGTDTEHSSFTGAVGEITVDTTNDTLRVHDGSTAGGVRLAKLSEAGGSGTVTSVDSGTGLTGGPITTSGTLSLASINNLNVLGNVSGSAAAPTSVAILDEDAMTSNSATALATQQSIKAYVDSQVVSKYSTGWSTSIPTSYSNVTYTHNLNTEDITYKVYVRDSSGNEHDITGGEVWQNVDLYNCSCVNITSTQITIRFFNEYLDWTTATSSVNPTARAWSTATNIKVVAIG